MFEISVAVNFLRPNVSHWRVSIMLKTTFATRLLQRIFQQSLYLAFIFRVSFETPFAFLLALFDFHDHILYHSDLIWWECFWTLYPQVELPTILRTCPCVTYAGLLEVHEVDVCCVTGRGLPSVNIAFKVRLLIGIINQEALYDPRLRHAGHAHLCGMRLLYHICEFFLYLGLVLLIALLQVIRNVWILQV